MKMEEWKDIQGYEGLYQVSSYGNVKRIFYHKNNSNTILRPAKDSDGYLRCMLCKNGIKKTHKVHRLVAESFIPRNEHCEVNHKNGIRDDNRVENLEWATRLNNMRHSIQVLGKKGTLTGRFSKNHPRSKAVVQYSLNGGFVQEYCSAFDAHVATGINHANINSCCLGKRATAGGCVWKYKI
jgi:hypothetical protein